ncbi:RNA polymerase sigma factor [Proteinivorax tanatarense]|uniref:RNA polymerase sigma factor n=1 Tax=Proteinivorax tanatarense TaxID=1260629 RepID=A0AAU7VRJ1_9FIRM
MTIQDYLLIRKIKAGDKQAFETLVQKHYQNIFSYCIRRTGNKVVATDLTQDIFLKLIKAIYSYKFTGKFKNFLFTIAVNTCNDYYKKNKYSYEDIDALQKADDSPQPIEQVIHNEQAINIKGKIDTLPDTQKDVIILYYYHDMKIKDISNITGVKLSTVKSRLKQGKKKLKKLLSEEDYLEE